MQSFLGFVDFVVLSVIMEADEALTYAELLNPNTGGGLVNEWLEQLPDNTYATIPLRSNRRLTSSLQTLRVLGYITQDNTITPTGKDFLAALGTDWQVWPKQVAIQEGKPVL